VSRITELASIEHNKPTITVSQSLLRSELDEINEKYLTVKMKKEEDQFYEMQKEKDTKMASKNASGLKLRGKGERNVIGDFVGEKGEGGASEIEKTREDLEKSKLDKRMNAR